MSDSVVILIPDSPLYAAASGLEGFLTERFQAVAWVYRTAYDAVLGIRGASPEDRERIIAVVAKDDLYFTNGRDRDSKLKAELEEIAEKAIAQQGPKSDVRHRGAHALRYLGNHFFAVKPDVSLYLYTLTAGFHDRAKLAQDNIGIIRGNIILTAPSNSVFLVSPPERN